MKIQKTTVVELEGRKALIQFQISDHADLEQSSQHMVCSVVVSTERDELVRVPVSLATLQIRALQEAHALIEKAEAAMQRAKP